jgi:hypothetical protein
VICADGDDATLPGDGAARATADFETSLSDQILRGGSDDRVFTNEEPGAGPDVRMDVAQVGLGNHVFRRFVYDRRRWIFVHGACPCVCLCIYRILTADLLSHGLANHRADFLSI